MYQRMHGLPHQKSAFPLVIHRQEPQRPVGLHAHDFTELVVITGGRGVHFSPDDAYEIATGCAYAVTGPHGYRDTHDLELVNVLFYPRRLSLALNEARKLPGYHAFFALEPRYRKRHGFRSCLRLSVEELPAVTALVDAIEDELHRQRSGYEFLATALLMQLIGRLARAYARMKEPASRDLIRLGEVLSYLEQHYAEPVNLEKLCDLAHLSESSLLRTFKAVTGHAPIEYLIRLRLSRACELLRAGELNVTETALRVGFGDSNYFTRQFRRVHGVTPREYARRSG
jgi:AraC-like DNA-binding protein